MSLRVGTPQKAITFPYIVMVPYTDGVIEEEAFQSAAEASAFVLSIPEMQARGEWLDIVTELVRIRPILQGIN